MFDEIEFPNEDELKKPIPEGTVANVKLRRNYDREKQELLPLGDLKTGKSQKDGTPYIVIPIEVVDGQYAGEWAGTALFVRPSDRRFRKAYNVITGVDVSEGGKFSYEDFVSSLKTGIFEVELGPERQKKGSDEPPKFTEIKKWISRSGEREDVKEVADPPAAEPADAEVSDEDMPF